MSYTDPLDDVPKLLGILEDKVSLVRASIERHNSKNVLGLMSAVHSYAELLGSALDRKLYAEAVARKKATTP